MEQRGGVQERLLDVVLLLSSKQREASWTTRPETPGSAKAAQVGGCFSPNDNLAYVPRRYVISIRSLQVPGPDGMRQCRVLSFHLSPMGSRMNGFDLETLALKND